MALIVGVDVNASYYPQPLLLLAGSGLLTCPSAPVSPPPSISSSRPNFPTDSPARLVSLAPSFSLLCSY